MVVRLAIHDLLVGIFLFIAHVCTWSTGSIPFHCDTTGAWVRLQIEIGWRRQSWRGRRIEDQRRTCGKRMQNREKKVWKVE